MLIIYLRFIKDLKKLCVLRVLRGENANALPPSSQRLPSMQPTPSLFSTNSAPPLQIFPLQNLRNYSDSCYL